MIKCPEPPVRASILSKIIRKISDRNSRADSLYSFSTKYINPWLRKLGLTLVAHHFYQTVPDDRELGTYRNTKRPVEMIDWDLDAQALFLEEELSAYRKEYNDPTYIGRYGYREGPYPFSSGEAEFYYALIRRLRPKKIIEIGAGGSSLVALAALHYNYQETSQKAEFITIEPFPCPELKRLSSSEHCHFHPIWDRVQNIDPQLFEELKKDDILFVDSSHVFKTGSDVEYEFLKIYPRLATGVHVHIHDIFTPRDYPPQWNSKFYRFWNEQYFLEVFLAFNSRFKVLAALNMLHHSHFQCFRANISGYREERFPGSFWMKVN